MAIRIVLPSLILALVLGCGLSAPKSETSARSDSTSQDNDSQDATKSTAGGDDGSDSLANYIDIGGDGEARPRQDTTADGGSADGGDTSESEPEPQLFGDINRDQRVDAADVDHLAQQIGNGDTEDLPLEFFDANQDDRIDEQDVTVIDAYVKSDIASLPLLYGDVTGNGEISGLDAAKILRHAENVEALAAWQLAVADANGDQVVDSADAHLIAGFAAGTIAKIPTN